MDIIDFFNHDVSELPKEQSRFEFEQYVQVILKHYEGMVKILDRKNYLSDEIYNNLSKIESLNNDLFSVIDLYLNGSVGNAAKSFNSAIINNHSYIEKLLVGKDISGTIGNLYRIRLSHSSNFQRDEMFHIPFEKRHLVKTQRYSIPGVPCLYLSSSIIVAWEELSRPSYDDIHVSRFLPLKKSNIKILDFGFRPAQFAALIKSNSSKIHTKSDITDFLISYATIWPLIALCSIKTKFRDATFKVEYIVPQLLFEYIRSSLDYDGVRYFSMNIKNYYGNPALYQNFAFPVKSKKEEGLCDVLSSKFQLTDSLSWQLAKSLNYKANYSKIIQDPVEIIQGLFVPYHLTDFGYMEAVLNNLPLETIKMA